MTAGAAETDSPDDDLRELRRRRRRPAVLLGYGLVIAWIVAGFLVQLMRGECPVP